MNLLKTLGLIGDVHSDDESLALAIRTLQAERLDAIVCTGDIPTGPGDINVCCDLLRQHDIATIRGNHDRWLMKGTLGGLPFATRPSLVAKSSWTFLQSLPVTRELETTLGLAQLCHGLGEEDMVSILPEQDQAELDEHPILHAWLESERFRIILNGHSHHRMVRRHHSLTIINAGTLRRDHEPCFAAIDFVRERVRFWNIIDRRTATPSDEFPMS